MYEPGMRNFNASKGYSIITCLLYFLPSKFLEKYGLTHDLPYFCCLSYIFYRFCVPCGYPYVVRCKNVEQFC